MSAVLRKKIQMAGGLAPKILQCAPLWEALTTGTRTWADETYGQELEATVTRRKVISGEAALERMGESFSFVPVTKNSGALAAVSIDRAGAARYAAARLAQSTDSLINASSLFLKLLCEQPARTLWSAVEAPGLTVRPAEEAVALADPDSVPDAIEPHARIVEVAMSVAARGEEDGWLLEGEEEPPEVTLFFKLAEFEALARRLGQKSKAAANGRDASSQAALRTRLRQSSLQLDAVLDRVNMTIADCSRLEVGQVLPLEGLETGHLSLAAETMNGSVEISQGEMGNWKGQRALKLKTPVVESFVREIAEI